MSLACSALARSLTSESKMALRSAGNGNDFPTANMAIF